MSCLLLKTLKEVGNNAKFGRLSYNGKDFSINLDLPVLRGWTWNEEDAIFNPETCWFQLSLCRMEYIWNSTEFESEIETNYVFL